MPAAAPMAQRAMAAESAALKQSEVLSLDKAGADAFGMSLARQDSAGRLLADRDGGRRVLQLTEQLSLLRRKDRADHSVEGISQHHVAGGVRVELVGHQRGLEVRNRQREFALKLRT